VASTYRSLQPAILPRRCDQAIVRQRVDTANRNRDGVVHGQRRAGLYRENDRERLLADESLYFSIDVLKYKT
jgi:hypothetical protein